jgi:hypothetical protein
LLLILLCCVVTATACGDGSSAALEARRVFERTTPPGLGSCWSGELRRISTAFEASCQLSLSGDWNDYKRWVTSAIKPYGERSETPEAITFSRTTEGDFYTVRAEWVNDPPIKSVRIVFHAAAW